MDNCIFCKISKGEIPCAKIWEDDKHLAFLDINPNTLGMTIVIPKKHSESYMFNIQDADYSALMLASKTAGKMLEKALGVPRVAFASEGVGVNHAHVKLYPLYMAADTKEASHRIFFEQYEGYITTELGPQRSLEELKMIADEIIKRAA
jgi:histidine triad (HIT) family protein